MNPQLGAGGTFLQGGNGNSFQNAAGSNKLQNAAGTLKLQNASGTPAVQSSGQDFDKWLASQYKALNSYTPPAVPQTPIPRLASFDVSSAYDKALAAAKKAVNPVYAAELNRFVAQQNQKLSEQNQTATAGKSALDLALQRLTEDNSLTRGRTAEDTTSNINDINTQQDVAAREGGLTFDAANRALNEGLGASGMAGSGLGQQQVDESQGAMRRQSNEQVRQSENKVQAANTLMTRTFQDLDTQEARTTQDTGTKKGQIDIDLQNFIKNQHLDLQSEKAREEAAKQGDIVTKANAVQDSLVKKWISSLKGQGYNAQEIALAAQIYG